jgi:hypothetical protein
MSSHMRTNLVCQNLLQKFIEKYDTFYNDPEFNYISENVLIAMIASSLQYELNDSSKDHLSLLPMGVMTN